MTIEYVMVMHDGKKATKFMSEDYCKDLMEQLAAAQSQEVCTVAHENVETCGYCQRDRYAHANREQAAELTKLREEIALFGAWQKRDIAQGEEIERLRRACDRSVAISQGHLEAADEENQRLRDELAQVKTSLETAVGANAMWKRLHDEAQAELAACREKLTLITQWQVSDGSSIRSPGKAEYGNALASVQNIAQAAIDAARKGEKP